MSMEKYRQEIDIIDEELVRLFNKRILLFGILLARAKQYS